MGFNTVILQGNLTKDPEIRYAPNGNAVCNFGLAVNEPFSKDGEKKDKVYFANVVCFGKTAENASKFLSKGSSALIQGRITEQKWESDGKQHSKTVIEANIVKFLDSKKAGLGKADDTPPLEEHSEFQPF